jgi:transcriptional regulator with XRE-family HTH domain
MVPIMPFSSTLTDEAVLAELGQRLAQQRLLRNWQQHELANEAGLSLRTLSRIEAGEPSQTINLLRVLRALGLLDNLEALVPPPLPSPMQQLQLQGRQRKRASRRSRQAPHTAEPNAAWQWGDD